MNNEISVLSLSLSLGNSFTKGGAHWVNLCRSFGRRSEA